MYYIIRKVHAVNNEITYTPIGYVLTVEDEAYMNQELRVAEAEQWIRDNFIAIRSGTLNPATYFDNHSPFYVGGHTTNDITGMNLNLITNLDNPEGV